MKKDNLIESILDKVMSLKDLGGNAEKAADKFYKSNKENGCLGVAVIAINEIGTSCATAGNKSKIKQKDFIQKLKEIVASLEEKPDEKQKDEDKEADRLFNKLQDAVDKMDDKEALIKAMTDAAINITLAGATALDGLKKVNKAVGNVLTDSELEILDKSLRKKHEKEQGDDDED